jgi:hypothetical protein
MFFLAIVCLFIVFYGRFRTVYLPHFRLFNRKIQAVGGRYPGHRRLVSKSWNLPKIEEF